MKVAFVVGHHKLLKGAKCKLTGLREYDFFKKFNHSLELYGDVFYHKPSTYTRRQRAMARKTKNYDLVFELHFNSLDGSISGCEALYYYKNDLTKHLSQFFCDLYTSKSKTRNRGAKPLRKGQRGYGFVYEQKPPAILLEPFFGDNLEDCESFYIVDFMISIRDTIEEFKKLR